MEPVALRIPRWWFTGAALVLLAGLWFALRSSGPTAPAERPRRIVPEGTRVRVEVLNASEVRGLARQATLFLRDVGFDVVRFSGDEARRDSTLIVDRTGHPEWARWASEAMGGASVVSRPDSGRLVDLTILVGARWRAPTETFYP